MPYEARGTRPNGEVRLTNSVEPSPGFASDITITLRFFLHKTGPCRYPDVVPCRCPIRKPWGEIQLERTPSRKLELRSVEASKSGAYLPGGRLIDIEVREIKRDLSRADHKHCLPGGGLKRRKGNT